MNLYMQLGEIKGSATDEKHKEWIQIHSWSFSGSRPISFVQGTGAFDDKSVSHLSDLAFSKDMDKSSVYILQALLKGEDLKKVVIHQTTTQGKAEGEPYLEITMENCRLSSHSWSGSGGSIPMETFTLVPQKIEWKYLEYDAAGTAPTPHPLKYDLSVNKVE